MATIKVEEGEGWKSALRRARNKRVSRNQLITVSVVFGIAFGSCSAWGIMSYMGG